MSELVQRTCQHRVDPNDYPGQPIEEAHLCGKPAFDVLMCSDLAEIALCIEHWVEAQEFKGEYRSTVALENWRE